MTITTLTNQINEPFEMIPRKLVQDLKLSFEAKGLLCFLQSLPKGWKIYKTQLYRQFDSNKETSVRAIWKECVEHGYIIEFKKRDGKRYEYNYFFSLTKFSKTEISDLISEQKKLGFEMCNKIDTKQLRDFEEHQKNATSKSKAGREERKVQRKIEKEEKIIKDDSLLLKEFVRSGKNKVSVKLLRLIISQYNTVEKVNHVVKIILNAKKSVEKNAKHILNFDDYIINQIISESLANTLFVLKSNENIRSHDNYLFKSMVNAWQSALSEVQERENLNGIEFINWLDGEE